MENEEEIKNQEENKCEKALADTIIDLKKQVEEANKKREEADARAVELVKILRNTGTQTEPQEKAKEKYSFILPFNQNISLKEHLEKYKKQVSAREKKSLKLFKKQEKKETKNKG